MALVRNNSDHRVPLTAGYLNAGETRNIDTSPAWEQSLLADGTLAVVDGSEPPPATTGFYSGPLKTRLDYDVETFPQAVVPMDLRGLTDGQVVRFDAGSGKFVPVDAATQAELDALAAQKGQASGIATLDSGGRLPDAQLPSSVELG